jgi:hypothetical protein
MRQSPDAAYSAASPLTAIRASERLLQAESHRVHSLKISLQTKQALQWMRALSIGFASDSPKAMTGSSNTFYSPTYAVKVINLSTTTTKKYALTGV